MVRVNVEAVVDLTGRFLPGMVERGRGAVINVASIAAFQPLPGSATYAASKSFVLSFSEAIRTELRGSGVTVTAVCPGPVKTEFTDAAGMCGHRGRHARPVLDDRRGDRPGGGPGRRRATSGSWCPARSTAPVDLSASTRPVRCCCRWSERIWGATTARGSLEELMPALEARGVELSWSERGRGRPGAAGPRDGDQLRRLGPRRRRARRAGARAIVYDRRGWGASSAPDGYRRTTVEEQSEDAAVLLESLDAGPAVVCGAGLGAVIALDLLLRRPELLSGAVLIEPPVLGLCRRRPRPSRTTGVALEEAVRERRRRRRRRPLPLRRLCRRSAPRRTGCPTALTADARERPASLFAELGAAAGWSMPLLRLAGAERPVADRHGALDPAAAARPPPRRWPAALRLGATQRGRDRLTVRRTSAPRPRSRSWPSA